MSTRILARESDSNVCWFEGNFADHEENHKKRSGGDIVPRRVVQEAREGLTRRIG